MEDRILPTIDLVRCTGCGFCVEYCPTGAVALVDERPVITQPHACSYCGMCEDMCPAEAVALVYEIVPSPEPKTRQRGEFNDSTDRAD